MENPKGTVVFTTIGRPFYGFDVFSVRVPPHLTNSSFFDADEHCLTDGISINYNAQFITQQQHQDQSIVYISERTGFPSIFLSKPKPERLSLLPKSLFYDRPVVRNSRLYFISAFEKPDQHFKSWSALYAADLSHQKRNVTRLTPNGVVDFSPAVSLSGRYIAVASYGSRPWAGEFHELYTDIVVFKESDPDKRFVVCERGGWPTWSRESTIYFHRQADDGWWSIFQVEIPEDSDDFSGFPKVPVRVTPPGVHCFTPAAMHDGQRFAVATRRRNKDFRHIEIFDVASRTFYPVTELLNPSFHHYNPFVSPDSSFIGYHRFRGYGKFVIPNLEPVKSPIEDLPMLRLNGSFPSFSPAVDFLAFNPSLDESNGGLKIVKSNGSKRWTLIKDRVAFYNSWSPTENHVIFTSLGPIFASPITTVQIARVTFDPSDLKSDGDEIKCAVKILTKEDTGNNAFPSCSPDGKSVVFRSGRSGHKNLYIIDAVDGEFNGSIRQLTDGTWIDTMPSWSPKGDLIAFSSNRHNPENVEAFSIYVIKPDGSDLKRIHVAGPHEVDRERLNHVCFSRDGEWLLFSANLGSVTAEPVSWPNQFQPYGDLYTCRLDGSGLRRLTWNGFENGTPAWHSEYEVDLDKLSLDEDDGDKLTGQFEEPRWISCEI